MATRTSRILLFLVVIGLAGSVPAGADIDIGFFYQSLAPYGEWVSVSPYGWVWTPSYVEATWRPYTDGHWVYTDVGWTYVSDFPWAWACYHYGRWFFSDDYGWCWVPGTVWSPAWVAWRSGDGYIGWAPLPPGVGWNAGAGLNLRDFDLNFGIDHYWWSFVEEKYFAGPGVSGHIMLPARNITLLEVTRNITDYTASRDRIFDRGIDPEQLEKVTGERIRRLKLVAPGPYQGPQREAVRGGDVVLFHPRVSEKNPAGKPRNLVRPEQRIPPAELAGRQQMENQKLASQHEEQQRRLEALHSRALREPEKGVPNDELERRQEAERRAMEEEHKREAMVLESRHARQQKEVAAAHGFSSRHQEVYTTGAGKSMKPTHPSANAKGAEQSRSAREGEKHGKGK
jgi:hypothetical protein